MKACKYNFDVLNKENMITYNIYLYEYFEVRQVMIGNQEKGEYHLKLLDLSDIYNAVNFFKRELMDSEVGLIDASGILKLEYSIYVITKDPMSIEGMLDSFERIDKLLISHNGQKNHD